jgi:hypothetical protein
MRRTPGTSAVRFGLVCAIAALSGLLWWTSAAAQDPCENPGNKTFNCQFDTFTAAPGGEVPEGWWPFVLSGHPAFDAASDTPKFPALRIWADGEGFVAGIYQEVSGVEVGATYEAFVGWAVFQSAGPEMGRAIGIDPTGGTDPQAGSVVWSPEVWEKKRTNPELRVRAVAQSDRITVFVRVNNPRTYGADQAFLDAVSLIRDEPVPVVPPAEIPTDTPVPEPELPPDPTATPVLESAPAPDPTATAVPVPTDTPVPTATATETAVPTPTATDTPEPTATSTPSPVPPTATRVQPSPEVWVLASASPAALATAPFSTPAAARANVSGGGNAWMLVTAAVAGGLTTAIAGWRARRRG